MTYRCCNDVAVHNHGNQTYRNGRPYGWRFAFEWRLPRIVLVRPARRQFSVVLNRYPGVVIGIAVYFGRRGLSLLWGRPGRIIVTIAPGHVTPREKP